jgi:hypothetical protein
VSRPVGTAVDDGIEHDKYDPADTVGELRPDVVAQGLTAAQVQPYG